MLKIKGFSRESDLQAQAEREGFEPSVRLPAHRFSRPDANSTNDEPRLELRESSVFEVPEVVPSKTVSPCIDLLPPELAAVVAAWPRLPGAVRAGISAMVVASQTSVGVDRNEPTGGVSA